jgi:diphthamide synthase (EF-2-diphthine--ammonia ligase)
MQQKHPEIEGVSSGAIWSSYQKKRVEDVYKISYSVALASVYSPLHTSGNATNPNSSIK